MNENEASDSRGDFYTEETQVEPGVGIPEPDLGSTIGRYQLLNVLGRGGMGVVYRAHDTQLDRNVALKVLRTDVDEAEEAYKRFQREARLAARLDHPHLVPILDVGIERGRPFLVMTLIAGEDLSDLITRERETGLGLNRSEKVALLRDVALAIHHAHGQGVVHRDIKPSNVLVDERGLPYVTDFGLAKELADPGGVTASGVVLGTPTYMAPEQIQGLEPLHPRTDVYSLGTVLYTLLCLEPPFQHDRLEAVFNRILSGQFRRPREVDSSLSVDLERIICSAMQRDPEDRYESALTFAEDLDRFLRGTRISPPGPGFVKRTRGTLARFGPLALLVVTLGLAGLLLFRSDADSFGRIRVTSDPPGAKVWWLARTGPTYLGQTSLEHEFSPGTHRLGVVHTGRQWVEHLVRVEEGEPTHQNFQLPPLKPWEWRGEGVAPSARRPILTDRDGDGILDVILVGWVGSEVRVWSRVAGETRVPDEIARIPVRADELFEPRLLGTSWLVLSFDRSGLCIVPLQVEPAKRPIWVEIREGLVAAPVVVDLDGDGIPEIVALDREGGLHVAGPDGRRGPRHQTKAGSCRVGLTPFDLEGDGRGEVLVVSDNNHRLYAYRYGQDGWKRLWRGVENRLDWRIEERPVVVAISKMADERRFVEIVLVAEGVYLHSLRLFVDRIEKGWDEHVGRFIQGAPAVGDLDGNGRHLVVISGFQEDSSEGRSWIQSWIRSGPGEGALSDEWKTDLDPEDGALSTTPVLADLFGDGRLEVVVRTEWGRVIVLDGATGERLWSTRVGSAPGSAPVVRDLAGDRTLLIASDDGWVFLSPVSSSRPAGSLSARR